MTLPRVARRGRFLAGEVLLLGLGLATALLSLSAVRSAESAALRVPYPRHTFFVGRGSDRIPEASAADLVAWHRRRDIFSHIGAFSVLPAVVETPSAMTPVKVAWVTGGMIPFLPARPAAGRMLDVGDFKGEVSPDVVVTERLARELGLTSPVGEPIRIGGHSYQIIGVFPAWARFPFPAQPDVLEPFQPGPPSLGADLCVLGELRDGLTAAGAEHALNGPAGEAGGPPETPPARLAPIAVSLDSGAVQVARYGLALGFVTLVLLLGTASLIELLDTTRRRREHSIRLALGATPQRLLLRRASDVLLLCVAGALEGALLVAACEPLLSGPRNTGWTAVPRLDPITLGCLGCLVAFSCFAVSIAPSVIMWRTPPYAALREERASVSRSARRARMAILAVQITVLVAFGLSAARLAGNTRALATEPLGIQVGSIWDAEVAAPPSALGSGQGVRPVLQQLRARLRSLPGVAGAALSSEYPTGGAYDLETPELTPRGEVPTPKNSAYFVPVTFVDPHYLQLLGCRLIAGRYFDTDDFSQVPYKGDSAILSEPLARKLFGSVNPVGREIEYRGLERYFSRVVGVVAGMRTNGLEAPVAGEMFRPLTHPGPLSITVKMTSSVPVSFTEIRDVVSASLPGASLRNFGSLEERYKSELALPLERLAILGFLSGLAGLVAALGLASAFSATVKERDLEIGIRRALGARERDIASALVRPFLPWVAVGLAVGLLLPTVLPAPLGLRAQLAHGIDLRPDVLVAVGALLLVGGSLWVPLRAGLRRPVSDLLRTE